MNDKQIDELINKDPPGGSNVTGRTFRTVGAADRCLVYAEEGDDPFIFPPPFSLLAQRSRCRSTVMHRHLPVYYPNEEHQLADTYTNPQEAAMAAQKALAFMSVNLNKGIEQVNEAQQEMNKVNKILNKHLKD